ncbi:hypothetical protein KI688_009515 [Linnemannia hyalina]|uniref:RING-type domain-containing protein n=1 Tax=Linnemannia hyalina TaxID=64524 RepID=A0A9P7Y1N4_9FUNG|nr:hypothetical protein KI688_009515 [Linnemannia hyalina]
MASQHTVPVLKVDMLAPSCDRCGKDFKAKRKSCHNCGMHPSSIGFAMCVQVCKDCSSFKTRLPQFGYAKWVSLMYKMDDAALAKLNIKTLKRYLASYNISTHGMLEKQELIKAIQENRPLPEASEVYFRKNTPDTAEKSTRIEEEIYSTSSHLPQGSGEERFWDLDKFFAKLFGNDDAPPRPPQRPEPTSTYAQKPQTAPRPQSYQQQLQSQPQPQSQPTKQGPFNFTQQPQPQPYQQQQYGYPPIPTPQPGATPHQAMPTRGTHPYASPTGAAPTFFPAGSPPPNQGYFTTYPPGAASEQGGCSPLNGHTQYQQHPFAQGAQANYQSTNVQYQENQTYNQQTYQQCPSQKGQQQRPFAYFQEGASYNETQSRPQPQAQPQAQQHPYQQHPYQQHPYQQQYNQNQHFHNQQQQQQQHSHYTQQPQPAPYPASSTFSGSTRHTPNSSYGSNNSPSSQPKPQTTPSQKPTPQASPRPTPTPQAAPRPTPTPQAVPRPTSTPQSTPQPTQPTSTSRPASSFTAPETPRPQATSRPSPSTSSQSRPAPPTPEPPHRGPRAPQDRNDYSAFGSESGSTPYSSTHSRQGSTAPESSEIPPTPTPSSTASSRPPRQSNRGPQTEHSASLLTIEEIVSENVEPSTLSIKVIKSLLDTNFVSYVGVVEKSDLVGQLQKLMISTKAEQVRVFNEQEAVRKQSEQQEQQKQQQEQQKQQQQQKASSTGSATNGGKQFPTTDDEHRCKVCFEASLNCVMLNCGHMSTCMDCGKKIMEGPRVCPICREYVVKLLHIFRA